MSTSTNRALVIGRTKHELNVNGYGAAPSTLLVDWETIERPDAFIIKTHQDSAGNVVADLAVSCECNPRDRGYAKESRCPYIWACGSELRNPLHFPEAEKEVTKFCYDTGIFAVYKAIQLGYKKIYTIGLDMARFPTPPTREMLDHPENLERNRFSGHGRGNNPWFYYRNMAGFADLIYNHGVKVYKAWEHSRLPCPVEWPFGGME